MGNPIRITLKWRHDVDARWEVEEIDLAENTEVRVGSAHDRGGLLPTGNALEVRVVPGSHPPRVYAYHRSSRPNWGVRVHTPGSRDHLSRAGVGAPLASGSVVLAGYLRADPEPDEKVLVHLTVYPTAYVADGRIDPQSSGFAHARQQEDVARIIREEISDLLGRISPDPSARVNKARALVLCAVLQTGLDLGRARVKSVTETIALQHILGSNSNGNYVGPDQFGFLVEAVANRTSLERERAAVHLTSATGITKPDTHHIRATKTMAARLWTLDALPEFAIAEARREWARYLLEFAVLPAHPALALALEMTSGEPNTDGVRGFEKQLTLLEEATDVDQIWQEVRYVLGNPLVDGLELEAPDLTGGSTVGLLNLAENLHWAGVSPEVAS
ncbi:hypothetical protein SCB71_21135 (plasmid) [Herbiconiux sp. KACC 21604]|uniref:hypothetical protein n=1 Tax=unclassified Herbiconiux TaxID=2618217 RepID=UPI00149282B0|nr:MULTISPECIES: hypothetical protein [unclassified Herbiconiux]QJU56250.1 hypothetical protein HL652_20930 [Herbiconiux sp. SALV-R1]WPO88864.1 hypothetical protein SCB71_21135 [Herbiconiux sp. KACC 21604]